MNGVECFLQIKQLRPEVKVMLMTGYCVETLIRQATKHGVHKVLNKPLDMEMVLEVMNAIRGTKPAGTYRKPK